MIWNVERLLVAYAIHIEELQAQTNGSTFVEIFAWHTHYFHVTHASQSHVILGKDDRDQMESVSSQTHVNLCLILTPNHHLTLARILSACVFIEAVTTGSIQDGK